MSPRLSLEEQLDRLHALRGSSDGVEARQAVEEALRARSSLVVAAAAELVEQGRLADLAAPMIGAFGRFMLDAARTDKGCRAKTALVRALGSLDRPEHDLYLQAVRHVQLEPVYGGRADTACELRAAAGMALLNTGYPDVMTELVTLLADREKPVRIAAARALAGAGRDAGALALRLRVLVGETDPEVLVEHLAALLSLGGDSAVAFVGGLLDAPDLAVAESAALALGGSRRGGAVDLLCRASQRRGEIEFRRTAFLALALVRSEPATRFLLDQVRDAPASCASDALAALATYRHDGHLRAAVVAAARHRTEPAVRSALAEGFGAPPP